MSELATSVSGSQLVNLCKQIHKQEDWSDWNSTKQTCIKSESRELFCSTEQTTYSMSSEYVVTTEVTCLCVC